MAEAQNCPNKATTTKQQLNSKVQNEQKKKKI